MVFLSTMSDYLQQLRDSIAALEAQRLILGEVVVESLLAPARAKLAELAAAQTGAPPQAIKQATVLFMDIVGSTPLSLQLDPEAFHGLIDGVLRKGTAEVEALGGKIVSYAGDNLIAVFGGVQAREDAAERAVRAGLILLEIGRGLHDEVLQRHGLEGSNVRVGIHTGSILLGGGVQADNTISGLNVNIAARMEQTAPPGAMRISSTTYGLVRGVFDVEPQAPIDVKGLTEPLRTYLVLRARSRAFRVASRGLEGVETRMVARDAELEELQASFLNVYQYRRLEVVLVVAEAGLGKSRLLYEFDNWADERPEVFTIFQGRANPQTPMQPYGLLRSMLAWRYQLLDSDSMQTAKEKLVTGLAEWFVDENADFATAHAHLLGHLIGLDFSDSPHVSGIVDDAKQIRNRAFHAAALMFRRVAQRTGNPVVLQLDDLHWGDDASLDFLNYLTQIDRDVPLLVIGLTRPVLFERRTDWRSTEGLLKRIHLEPLDKTGSRLLVDELLKKLPQIPPSLREFVTSGAEGNPFYMEELVKMLVDQGVIDSDADPWSVHLDKLHRTRVPPTLTGILQARLDSLPPLERTALQQASVIGEVFWDQALAALDAQAPKSLPSLVQRELTLPRVGGPLSSVHEYAFNHHLLHQVTYETLLKSHKRELHAKAAHWLTHLTGARAGDFLVATAEHFERAEDYANAIEFYTQAAEHAKTLFVHQDTLRHVEHAFALLAPREFEALDHAEWDAWRWRLLDVREQTWNLLGKRDAQRADVVAMVALADTLSDDTRRAVAAIRQSHLALRTADIQVQATAAQNGVAFAGATPDYELRLKAQRLYWVAVESLEGTAAAMALAQGGLLAARQHGLRRIEGLCLADIAGYLLNQGQIRASMEMMSEVLLINRELGDRVNEAINVGNRGFGWLGYGALAEARSDIEAALAMSRAVGDRMSEGSHLINLSRLMLMQGNEPLALAHARAGLDIAIAAESADWQAIGWIYLGNAELALGRNDDARRAFLRAESLAQAIGSAWRLDALAGQVRVALDAGVLAPAVPQLETLLAQMHSPQGLEGVDLPRLIDWTCYKALTSMGDTRVAELLRRAHSALQGHANHIPDAELRHSFLTNIPENRALVTAWNALNAVE